MKDKQQWQQMTQQWHQQPTKVQFDSKAITSRLRKQKLSAIFMIVIEVAVLLMAFYFFYLGLVNDYGLSYMSWIAFGVIFGGIIGCVSIKERLKSINVDVMTTEQWFKQQIAHAHSQIKLARLTLISVVIFAIAFHCWLLMLHFFIEQQRSFDIKLYVFAVLWLSLFVIVANRIKGKALRIKQHYLAEQQHLS